MGLAGGADPDRGCWGQIAGFTEWGGRVNDLANAIEVVMVAAEVGDAVPAIRARKVQNGVVVGLVPGHIFWSDQSFAQSQCFAEDGKW